MTLIQQVHSQLESKLNWLNADWLEFPWSDGKPATMIPLVNAHGMQVVIMDIGATWLSCQLPIENAHHKMGREVVLRSPSLKAHMSQSAYLGAVIGRYANRIAFGRFKLNGKTYQLPQNQSPNSLHGGHHGFDKKRWQILDKTFNSVLLAYTSPDGEEGYPGELLVTVFYSLSDENELSMTYKANCTQETIVNLTNHAYFNLAGIESNKTAFDHQFQISAEHYIPVDESLIPLGELRSVSGTAFDLRVPQYIKQDYDHTFIFGDSLTDSTTQVAEVISPDKDLKLVIKTSKPAAQFYTGNYLAKTAGPYGEYQKGSGFAIETQYIPDGPNQFGLGQHQGILPAREQYRHTTSYGFEF